MEDKQLQNLKHKILDYKRFSFIFLFIGAFINIGSALPFAGKTTGKADTLMIASFIFIIISLLFYRSLYKAKKLYEEKR
ncbi:MAG TPA: YrhC family protein [Sporolactobacillaceae bacterium]|nr:YrhC family protein [Sporolactobacillaceae bacterium]